MSQGDLFVAYGGKPPRVRGSDTSEAAADSVRGVTGQLRARVFAFIGAQAHGATCDEVEASLGLRHQTASARVRELSLAGVIRDTGERRRTRSGRNAAVWAKP